MDFLLSRHPIYQSKINVAGYEIRSRAVADEPADEQGTANAERSMFYMFKEAGLDQIVGQHSCFINVTSNTLNEELWKGLPKDQVVLGYFEPFNPEDEVAQKLLKLVEDGPRLALSGQLSPESLEMFGDKVHALKLDVTSLSPEELEQKFHELRRYKASLLADRVDTYDDLEYCKGLGFDLYQGHFVSRSASQASKQIPVNRLAMMRVLARLQDPELSIADLEETISLDATLSYKLLTYANSPAVALNRNVESIGHAVRLIGLNLLRTWASVLLLCSVEDKPSELMTISLVRARMCERLSASAKDAKKESYFSAGLLSVIDALLDCSMEIAIAKLPLVDEVKAALISNAGPIGQALRCSIAYERADWDNVEFYGLPQAQIRDIYMEAIAWTQQLSRGLLP